MRETARTLLDCYHLAREFGWRVIGRHTDELSTWPEPLRHLHDTLLQTDQLLGIGFVPDAPYIARAEADARRG